MRTFAAMVFAICTVSTVNAQIYRSEWRIGFGAEGGFLDYEGSRALFNEAGARAEFLPEGSSIPVSLFIGGGSLINSTNILIRLDGTYFVDGLQGYGLFCGIAWMKPFQDASVWRQYGNHHDPPSLVTSNWFTCFSVEGGMKYEIVGFALEGFLRYTLSPVIWRNGPIGRFYILGISGCYMFSI